MKKLLLLFCTLPAFLCTLSAQAPAPSKSLTLEAIFAEGGLTGRAPETIKWSPDGTKVSWVQRDDSGEHGELWVLRERARSREPVEVREDQGGVVADPGASSSRSACWAAAALVGRLHGKRVSLGDRERVFGMHSVGHGHRSLRAATTCWTDTVAWPAAAA